LAANANVHYFRKRNYMSVEVRHLSKTYGSFAAVKDVSLLVETGKLVALVGPSGSGKTTLLRSIAGLEQPDPGSGSVLLHGRDVAAEPVGRRKIGFVFQHYALFKHMTVAENVAFGLRVRPWRQRPSRREIRKTVEELLDLVQLRGMQRRYPSQLSGGQRQRIALARALATKPGVLLLDEPFGALDAKVRRELRQWLRQLHHDVGITTIFVTHDQEEALEVADRVAVMNKGVIEQVGSPSEVYDHPASPFVQMFLGTVNLFRGRIAEDLQKVEEAAGDGQASPAGKATAYVRPHDVEVSRSANGTPSLVAEVISISMAGPTARVYLQLRDTKELVEAEMTRERHRDLALAAGEIVLVSWRKAKLFTDDYSI
jgi:sulfate/thiosulfate transport system ATP-binding protein